MIDSALLAEEFPQDDDLVYLNHAGISPWPARTTAAVSAFAEENSHRGALHYPAWSAKEDELREQLKTLINARSVDEIALAKNTSEALSMVACGLDWQAGDNVVISDEEFPSNRIPWQAQKRHGVEVRQVSLRTEPPEQALMEACDKNTRILSISSVQYASGLRLDQKRLGEFCRSQGILFCVDAIQSIGAHDFDVQRCHIDFAVADAHKWMLGPEGIALFYCRRELLERLALYQFGWHMVQDAGNYDRKDWEVAKDARRFECGSPNMLGIHGLSASLSLFSEIGMYNIEQAILEKTAYFIEELSRIKAVNILTPTDPARRAGIVSFTVDKKDPRVIQQALMQHKVVCACRGGGIRFSPHFYTARQKMETALERLSTIV